MSSAGTAIQPYCTPASTTTAALKAAADRRPALRPMTTLDARTGSSRSGVYGLSRPPVTHTTTIATTTSAHICTAWTVGAIRVPSTSPTPLLSSGIIGKTASHAACVVSPCPAVNAASGASTATATRARRPASHASVVPRGA